MATRSQRTTSYSLRFYVEGVATSGFTARRSAPTPFDALRGALDDIAEVDIAGLLDARRSLVVVVTPQGAHQMPVSTEEEQDG